MAKLSDYFQSSTGLISPFDRGIVLQYSPDLSADTSGNWNPDEDWAGKIVHADEITVTAASGWKRTAVGQAYHPTSYSAFALCYQNVPAINNAIRRYVMEWAQFSGTAPTTNDGLQIVFNYLDNDNYWVISVIWNGSTYLQRLYEKTATVLTLRDTITVSTAVDHPVFAMTWIDDFGDSVMHGLHIYETDNAIADKFSYDSDYSVASRPNKTATGFAFQMGAVTTEAKFAIRSISITELG